MVTNMWPVIWFIFDVVRFPPLFMSTVFFWDTLFRGYYTGWQSWHKRQLKELLVMNALQYGIYSYNGVDGVVRILVRGGIGTLPLFAAADYYRWNRTRVDQQLARVQRNFNSFILRKKQNFDDFKLDLFSPQGKYRKIVNSVMMMKKQACEICFEKKHRIEFCAPCNNRDHKVCVQCFALYVDDGMKSPNGSMFCCPFGEENCSFLSGKKVKNIFNHFRMDYFQKTLFQDLSLDVIEIRVEHAILKNVTLTLLDTGEALRCPFEECTNCVLYSEEAMEIAENFNHTMDQDMLEEETELNSPPKKNDLLHMLKSRLGLTMREKDEARITNSVLSAEFIGAKDETFDLRAFKCNGCRKASCVVCFKPWTIGEYNHSGVSCTEHVKLVTKLKAKWNEEKEVTRKVVKLKIMRGLIQPCPHCNELIEKNGGCNHMVCQKCSADFTWGAAPTKNFNEAALDL